MSKLIVLTWSFGVALCPVVAAASPSDLVVRDWNDPYARLEKQIAADVGKQPAATEMLDRNALILETDRDPLGVALRRARALIDYLKAGSAGGDADRWGRDLDGIAGRTAASGASAEAKASLYREVRAIGRQAAFANPLLDFDAILFAERKCAGDDNFSGGHMTTASFGHTQL